MAISIKNSHWGTPSIVSKGLTYMFDISNPKCYVGTGTTVNAITNSVAGISTVSGAFYDTGRFVAVADDSGNAGTYLVMYSDDGGVNWTGTTAGAASDWQSVTYGGGKFVAVADGETDRVMYSSDGISWTSASATEANSWKDVTYGDGKFVAVSSSGTNRVMYSTDAINWSTASAAEANQWFGVTYGNGKFVAVSPFGTNRVMYSSDGISWTSASATADMAWNSITYGDGKFVALARDNTGSGSNNTLVIMYSTDGINWSNSGVSGIPSDVNYWWWNITYGDGKYVAVSSIGHSIMYSFDGISWIQTTEPGDVNQYFYGVAYGNGNFVTTSNAGTTRALYSTDGINWSLSTMASSASESNYWYSVTYGGSKVKCFNFDGTDDYITIDKSYNELGLVTGGDYTIIAWVYIDSNFGQEKRTILSNSNGATQYFSWSLDNTGTPGSGTKNYSLGITCNSTSGSDGGFAGWTDTDISVPLDQWSMVSLRFSGSYVKFTINENVSYVGATNGDFGDGTMNNSGNDMYIGKERTGSFASDYFKGKISSVMFYNRQLSNDELLENYNSLKGRFGL